MVIRAVKLLAAHYYEHREAYTADKLEEIPLGWSAVVAKFKLGISGDWGDNLTAQAITRRRLEWLRRTKGAGATRSASATTPTSGAVTVGRPRGRRRRPDHGEGIRAATHSATIRIRNYPDVVAGDVLREVGEGVEWKVLTVTAGENEISCEVER